MVASRLKCVLASSPKYAAGMEITMRPDRPLIGAVALLTAGIAAILTYCHGNTAFNAGYPFSGCQLHIDITTTGPAVLGGMALIAVGLLLMAWALLVAIVSQIVRLFVRNDHDEVQSITGRSRTPFFETENYSGSLGLTEHKREM